MPRLVRSTDPETSRQNQTVMFDTTVKERVMKLFYQHGPMTDEQLQHEYGKLYGLTRGSTVRTRRKELVQDGWLRDTGETKRLNLTGNKGKVWSLAYVNA